VRGYVLNQATKSGRAENKKKGIEFLSLYDLPTLGYRWRKEGERG